MARVASFTTSGQDIPGGGMTLAALMARQKALADRSAALADQGEYPGAGTVLGGLGHVAQSLFAGLGEASARDQETQGRQALAQAMSRLDPTTGGFANPADQATAFQLDPDNAIKIVQAAIEARRAAAQRAEDRSWAVSDADKLAAAKLAEHEDTQAEARTTAQTLAGTQATAAEKLAQTQADAATKEAERQAAEKRLEEQATTAEAKRKEALPTEGSAKILDAYNKGQYGQPGSPEAMKIRDQALAKETALPASQVTVNTGGDSAPLRKKFDENIGEKVFPAYLAEAATAGNLKHGLELLDALGQAPQGPLVGILKDAFPGVDNAQAAFDSIVKRLAPTMRVTGSGSTSDLEYQGMLDALPSLHNHPEANRLISEMVKAQAGISIKRGDIITQWHRGQLTDDQAFAALNDVNSQSIMSPELKKMIDAVAKNQPVNLGTGGGDYTIEEVH